ncbi:hypothetical protein BH18CHL1_BH18CHL1_08180 [soil metagenome]|nr:alpha/beta hydrolase [Chloroflexota bacterium]
MQVVLAPGASGDATTLQPFVAGLLARGIDARAIDIPKRRAEAAVDSYLERSGQGIDTVIGGQSYGGRVASLAAARPDTDLGGLILLSYPLQAPGKRDQPPRTEHWAHIRCPVLFLSGRSDPLAPIGSLERAIADRLPGATLHTWPRMGHWLGAVADEVIERMADFVAGLGHR